MKKGLYKPAIWLAVAVLLPSVAWIVLAAHSRNGNPKESVRLVKVPAVQNKSVSSKAAKGFKVAKNAKMAKHGKALAANNSDLDENGEKLSPEMKQILADIQTCLDNEDRKALSKVCERIAQIQRERGEGSVPVSVRARAVEAIGLFLPATLAELVGFMADSDPEVVDSVFDQLDNLLNDTTIGDKELSGILVSMSKVVTNEDAVDSLVMAIDINMRNSVKVSTCKQIIDTGNDVVITRLKSGIADMLDVEVGELPSDNALLKEKLTEWLQENPDGEDDDNFYKGIE